MSQTTVSRVSPELASIAAQSNSLPPDVIEERREMREWSARVGYLGCSSPANPTKKQTWQPPFTVLPHVVANPKDLSTLIRGLRYHGWSYETDPLWNPIREYTPEEKIHYGICSIGSTESKNMVSIGVNTDESWVEMNSRSMSVKRQLDMATAPDSQSSSTSQDSHTEETLTKTLTGDGKRRRHDQHVTEVC